MNLSNTKKAVIALSLASIIWGVSSPVSKFTLTQIPAFSLGFIRFSIASLLLFPFVTSHLRIYKKDCVLLFLCALFGISLHISLFFFGVRLTSALNAGILATTVPLFTLFFAKLFLKEVLTKNILAGAGIGFLGILAIIGKDVFIHGILIAPLGDFLILLSVLSFVAYEIISKKLISYRPLTITFYSFLIGSFILLPFAFAEWIHQPGWISNVSLTGALGALYGIVFSSVFAYSFWQWGLSKIPASRVGFFLYLDPVAATIATVVLLNEIITFPFVVGSLLIFAGLFLAEGAFPYHPHRYKKHFSSKS